MGRCFVIQPFDRGKFDKRYDDVLAPAISAAGLDPYRVDRDPNVSIPIDEIQSGIESSQACLADITTDNPNVWFELGYSIASRREVVLICAEERTTRFPFDVQHRSIIKYSTESPRDFNELRESVTTRLTAILNKEANINSIARLSTVAAVEGLEPHEMAVLASVAQQQYDPDTGVSVPFIRQDLERVGFTRIAVALGLRRLLDESMLETYQARDIDGDPDTYYRVTSSGIRWLYNNRDKLNLREPPPPF